MHRSLENLKKSGTISGDDFEKAKKELNQMDNAQLDKLTNKAIGIMKENPDAEKLSIKEMEKKIK